MHSPETQGGFSAPGSGAQSLWLQGLLSLAGPEQGRLCYVSAAQTGTTQLFSESPDGFHTVLNSSLSWVQLKKAREEAQIQISPFPSMSVLLADGWGSLALCFRRNTTAETLISVFFPTKMYFPPPCTLPAHHMLKELTRLSLQSSVASSPFFSLGFFFPSLWLCLWDFPAL